MKFLAPISDADARGPFLRVSTEEPGRCGTCTALTTEFINRHGTTQCEKCDQQGAEVVRPN